MRTTALALLLWTAPLLALAGGESGDDGAAAVDHSAELDRLTHELDRLATKSQWKGVERTYDKLLALGVDLPASVHRLGGDAARSRGDATVAQRRYLKAERLEPSSTNEALDQYRSSYGVLEVRRVEATCIRLQPTERPFDPTHAAAIDHASAALAESGAFRGLVPAGTYTVGRYPVTVQAGMKPVVVQRQTGDGDCR